MAILQVYSPMPSRDDCVRRYARAAMNVVSAGIAAGGDWLNRLQPTALHRLVKSLNAERLYEILDDQKHPDKAQGIARELTGFGSFSALLTNTNVDYRDDFFLGGFIRGVVEGLQEIPREAIDQLKLSRQEEIELYAEYFPPSRTRFSDLFRAPGNN